MRNRNASKSHADKNADKGKDLNHTPEAGIQRQTEDAASATSNTVTSKAHVRKRRRISSTSSTSHEIHTSSEGRSTTANNTTKQHKRNKRPSDDEEANKNATTESSASDEASESEWDPEEDSVHQSGGGNRKRLVKRKKSTTSKDDQSELGFDDMDFVVGDWSDDGADIEAAIQASRETMDSIESTAQEVQQESDADEWEQVGDAQSAVRHLFYSEPDTSNEPGDNINEYLHAESKANIEKLVQKFHQRKQKETGSKKFNHVERQHKLKSRIETELEDESLIVRRKEDPDKQSFPIPDEAAQQLEDGQSEQRAFVSTPTDIASEISYADFEHDLGDSSNNNLEYSAANSSMHSEVFDGASIEERDIHSQSSTPNVAQLIKQALMAQEAEQQQSETTRHNNESAPLGAENEAITTSNTLSSGSPLTVELEVKSGEKENTRGNQRMTNAERESKYMQRIKAEQAQMVRKQQQQAALDLHKAFIVSVIALNARRDVLCSDPFLKAVLLSMIPLHIQRQCPTNKQSNDQTLIPPPDTKKKAKGKAKGKATAPTEAEEKRTASGVQLSDWISFIHLFSEWFYSEFATVSKTTSAKSPTTRSRKTPPSNKRKSSTASKKSTASTPSPQPPKSIIKQEPIDEIQFVTPKKQIISTSLEDIDLLTAYSMADEEDIQLFLEGTPTKIESKLALQETLALEELQSEDVTPLGDVAVIERSPGLPPVTPRSATDIVNAVQMRKILHSPEYTTLVFLTMLRSLGCICRLVSGFTPPGISLSASDSPTKRTSRRKSPLKKEPIDESKGSSIVEEGNSITPTKRKQSDDTERTSLTEPANKKAKVSKGKQKSVIKKEKTPEQPNKDDSNSVRKTRRTTPPKAHSNKQWELIDRDDEEIIVDVSSDTDGEGRIITAPNTKQPLKKQAASKVSDSQPSTSKGTSSNRGAKTPKKSGSNPDYTWIELCVFTGTSEDSQPQPSSSKKGKRKSARSSIQRLDEKTDDVDHCTESKIEQDNVSSIVWLPIDCISKKICISSEGRELEGHDQIYSRIATAVTSTTTYVVAFNSTQVVDVLLRYNPKATAVMSIEDTSTTAQPRMTIAHQLGTIYQWFKGIIEGNSWPVTIADLQASQSEYSDCVAESSVEWEQAAIEAERIQFDKLKMKETLKLPTSQQALKNHPVYCLEKFLTRYQALYPSPPKIVGYCGKLPVYLREHVHTLHTKARWLKEGRVVRDDEIENPYKEVKALHTSSQATTRLYGEWQTDEYTPPIATDGIVPKNERGNVELWHERCLPIGTVHLRYSRISLVAKKLGIDYAPALTGFETRNGRSTPVIDGIVVCEEYVTVLVEAYRETERIRLQRVQDRISKRALGNWKRLIVRLVTHHRITEKYSALNDEYTTASTSAASSSGTQNSNDIEEI